MGGKERGLCHNKFIIIRIYNTKAKSWDGGGAGNKPEGGLFFTYQTQKTVQNFLPGVVMRTQSGVPPSEHNKHRSNKIGRE